MEGERPFDYWKPPTDILEQIGYTFDADNTTTNRLLTDYYTSLSENAYDPRELGIISAAMRLAAFAHDGEKRKSEIDPETGETRPYFDHLARVTTTVLNARSRLDGSRPPITAGVAAWLHDVAEDCGDKIPEGYSDWYEYFDNMLQAEGATPEERQDILSWLKVAQKLEVPDAYKAQYDYFERHLQDAADVIAPDLQGSHKLAKQSIEIGNLLKELLLYSGENQPEWLFTIKCADTLDGIDPITTEAKMMRLFMMRHLSEQVVDSRILNEMYKRADHVIQSRKGTPTYVVDTEYMDRCASFAVSSNLLPDIMQMYFRDQQEGKIEHLVEIVNYIHIFKTLYQRVFENPNPQQLLRDPEFLQMAAVLGTAVFPILEHLSAKPGFDKVVSQLLKRNTTQAEIQMFLEIANMQLQLGVNSLSQQSLHQPQDPLLPGHAM